jgi:hypothetical protein
VLLRVQVFRLSYFKDSSGFAVLLSANAMPELADLRPDFAEFGDNRYH